MYLEELTYKHSSPYFMPINFLFDNYEVSRDEQKALMLSELPAIFRKHGIPLARNDIKIYVNKKDNIADKLEFGELINTEKFETDEERMNVELARDFYDFSQKLTFKGKLNGNYDKLIKKLIYERYGYSYDIFNRDEYEKFLDFLNANIPENGFFEVEMTTEADFTDAKMSWLDIQERNIRRFFHTIKKVFSDTKVVFLSERFYEVYNVLKEKYPELAIDEVYLGNEDLSFVQKRSAVYINDFYGDKMDKIIGKDYVVFMPFSSKVAKKIPTQFTKDFSSRYLNFYYDTIDKDYYRPRKKMHYCSHDEFSEVIECLEAERRILEGAGFENPVEMFPVIFQSYFNFCLENHEHIQVVKDMFKETTFSQPLIDLLFDTEILKHHTISADDSLPITDSVQKVKK